MKFKAILFLFLCQCLAFNSNAHEGMWLPNLLNISEMQAMGMKMSQEDIYSVNSGSLKDAIVHFGGFCTGEIISSRGLLITNHHCGYRAIQSHSTVENNLLKDGFWSGNNGEELPNEGLFVRFISEIVDVSDDMLEGIDIETTEEARDSVLSGNRKAVMESLGLDEFQEAEIKAFYHGNQYILIKSVVYPDVRLVGTPPSSIGKFGADTDNWEWPRHTGDFSLFRIYMAEDGSPAEYSEENVPYSPDHHLPVSLDGVEEGDFTMIFGFPGSTNEYIPSFALEQLVEGVNPARIGMREHAMDVMDKAMRNDEAIQLKYASKFASLANYWKKWKGENQGLTKTRAIAKKRADEKIIREKIDNDARLFAYYSGILEEFEELYERRSNMQVTRNLLSELLGRIVDLYGNASLMRRAMGIYENNGEEAFLERMEQYADNVEQRLKKMDLSVDKGMALATAKYYASQVDDSYLPEDWKGGDKAIEQSIKKIYKESFLTSSEKYKAILDLSAEEIRKKIQNDPAVKIYEDLITSYQLMTYPDLQNINDRLNVLQRKYMRAQMDIFPDRTFYPDANSTMRITYGKVQGYAPRDAVRYTPSTTLAGVMEKYKPGDYEFDVPQKLVDLYEEGDYGQYSNEDGQLPVCFLGSNHTTGGNSGSPVIDAHGNFIGINFDRVWEGTMSDYNFDKKICRNIMVDARYILFIIDKYAGAGHLIEEMELVHPKQ